ncbi:putative GTPase activating protein for Arf-domain-containing protein [Chiua virens]|nr:putative GTPase activating protein for Arf-domain-containing protein [Chiua virens]
MSTSVSKIVAERNRRVLLELVLKSGNDICADCKARAPRWASHNLGIFICVNCASIHRKIGTHITKVKSITLDEWNKEQVEVMKENGNIKSNALYNPNEARHPPPTNMIDSERDSELEKFIRSKYEFKRFMDRKYGSTTQAACTAVQSHSAPFINSAQTERKASPGPPLPPKTPENLPKGLRYSSAIPSLSQSALSPTRSVSQPLPSLTASEKLYAAAPLKQPAATQSTIQKPSGPVWDDLISLQGPSQSSLPLQYSPIASLPPQQSITVQQPPVTAPNPFMKLSLGQDPVTAPLVASQLSPSTPGLQFPLTHPAPLSSPALHLGAINPFNQMQALLSQTASLNNTSFPTNSNPFFPPMPVASLSAPATPSMQPIAALPTGPPFLTPPVSYIPSQASTPAPTTPFIPAAPPTPGIAPNPFTPMGSQRQMPLSASGTKNPFSAMQMGQTGFSGASSSTGVWSADVRGPAASTLGHGTCVWCMGRAWCTRDILTVD